MNAWRLLCRNAIVSRREWAVFLSGFVEPVFYLFSIGVGVGALMHDVQVGSPPVPYAHFVAPAMLATSAMNGAIMDSTFSVFFRLKQARLYDAVLATPLTPGDIAVAETVWALARGGIYSAGFLLIMQLMGFASSWWALLALPACLLVGYCFAGLGMWATTYMKSWQDFEYVTLLLLPLVLFSGTFFPIDGFVGPVRWLIEVTPLYRGVVLCRELTTGAVGLGSLASVAYLAALGTFGLVGARRRLATLLLT